MKHKLFTIIIINLFNLFVSYGQLNIYPENDKCGTPSLDLKSYTGDYWGYNYDSLLNDISIWELSDYVEIESIGESTQGREIYELSITDPSVDNSSKHRIYIHARTHPGEVQSFWVTDEIINYLLSDSKIGGYLREYCIFNIIPMYNPDGVELEYARENANSIDIESNWSNETPEIEVVRLRSRFNDLMQDNNPIEIALNMHSAYACKRYFVYHHENGTSPNYAILEETYIESTRSHFLEGIEPYSYYVSWSSSTPTQYPESWWWLNHGENVLALTYEDMNCSSAGFYDKTAFSILFGISDYFNLGYVGIENYFSDTKLELNAYPNPFNEYISIEWNNFDSFDKAEIIDIMGRNIKTFSKNETSLGFIYWDGTNNLGNSISPGTYLLKIQVNQQLKVIKIIKQ